MHGIRSATHLLDELVERVLTEGPSGHQGNVGTALLLLFKDSKTRAKRLIPFAHRLGFVIHIT